MPKGLYLSEVKRTVNSERSLFWRHSPIFAITTTEGCSSSSTRFTHSSGRFSSNRHFPALNPDCFTSTRRMGVGALGPVANSISFGTTTGTEKAQQARQRLVRTCRSKHKASNFPYDAFQSILSPTILYTCSLYFPSFPSPAFLFSYPTFWQDGILSYDALIVITTISLATRKYEGFTFHLPTMCLTFRVVLQVLHTSRRPSREPVYKPLW